MLIWSWASKNFRRVSELVKNLDNNQNKHIIVEGDFNTFFISKLKTKGVKPLLKSKSIAKLVKIKESLDICDICRIRNLKSQNFTFKQNHTIGFMKHRLD